MNFVTELQGTYDIDLWDASVLFGLDEKAEIDIDAISCQIHWSLDLEARTWGLKGINPHVDKVILFVDFDIYYDDITKEELTKEMVIESDKMLVEFDAFQSSNDLCPTSIEIEGKSMTTSVFF